MGSRGTSTAGMARARGRRRLGMSLVELLLSMTILALIMGAMTSFIFVSTRSLPMTTSAGAARAQARAFLRQISDDARSAVKVMVSPDALVATPASTYDLAFDGMVLETPDRNDDGFSDFVWVKDDGGVLVRRLLLSTGSAIEATLQARTLRDWLSQHGPNFKDAGALRLGNSGYVHVTLDERAASASVDTRPRLSAVPTVDGQQSGAMEHLLSFARGGAMESAGGNERVLMVGPAAGDRVLIAMLPATPVPGNAAGDDVLWMPTRASLYVRRAWTSPIPLSCSARYTVSAWRMPMEEYLSGRFTLDDERLISDPVMVASCSLECAGLYAVRKVDLSFTTPVPTTQGAPCTGVFPFENLAPLAPREGMRFGEDPSSGGWLHGNECLVIEVRVPVPSDKGYTNAGGRGGCLPQYDDAQPAIALMANAGSGSESVVMVPHGGGGNNWQPANAGVAFDLWGRTSRTLTEVSASRAGETPTARGLVVQAGFEVPGQNAQRVIVTTRLGAAIIDVGGSGGSQQPETIE